MSMSISVTTEREITREEKAVKSEVSWAAREMNKNGVEVMEENVSVGKKEEEEEERRGDGGEERKRKRDYDVLEVKNSDKVSMDDVWRSIKNSGGGHEMKERTPQMETTAACGSGGMERAETFTKPVNFQLYANQMHHPVLEHEQDNANAAGGIKVPREVVQQLTTLREESKEEAERSVRASLPTGAEYAHTKRQLHQMLPMQQPPTPHIPQPLRPGTMTTALLYDSANISGKIARLQTLPPLYNSQSFDMLMQQQQQQQQHGLNVGGLFRECSPRLAAPATTAPVTKHQYQHAGASPVVVAAAAGSPLVNTSSMKAPTAEEGGGAAAWYPHESDPNTSVHKREEEEAIMKQAKNRESARRSRQKRQNYTIALEKQVEELTQLNHQMKLKIGEEMMARARKPTRTTLLDRRRRTSSF